MKLVLAALLKIYLGVIDFLSTGLYDEGDDESMN